MQPVKLVFLGDYCNSSNRLIETGPKLSQFLGEADAVLLDLEAPVIEIGNFRPEIKVGPNLSQPPAAIATCRTWGVTHYSLANNHIMDFGAEGLAATISELKGFTYFGAGMSAEEAYRPVFIDSTQGRIGLLAFAEAQFGVCDPDTQSFAGFAWFTHPKARRAVIETRKQCDYLIVQVHAGLEFVTLPLPEIRQRYREFVDLGADLVVGHHPHVFQGSEVYRNKWIHYSLGNFILDMMMSNPNASGAILSVTIDQQGLSSELHPLEHAHDKVEIAPLESQFVKSYQDYCEKLQAPDYLEAVTKICRDKWQEYYEDYYLQSLNALGTRPNIKRSARLLKRLMKRGRDVHGINHRQNTALLLHNIRIETHRWVVQRALSSE